MIDNHIYSVLPFYDSVDKQNFKKEWMYNDVFTVPLICPKNKLLPFQVKRSNKYNTLVSLELYCYDGTLIDDILADIPAGDIDIVSSQGYDFIIYYGNKALSNDLSGGFYFLKLYDGSQYWYSEIFNVKCFDWNKRYGLRSSNERRYLINNTDILITR